MVLFKQSCNQGNRMSTLSVLTGDIVNSRNSDAKHYDTMLYSLQQTLTEIKEHYAGVYEIFRGDSFQVTFKDPIPAMRCALLLKMALIASSPNAPVEVRLALGVGGYRDLRNNSGTSSGEAFELSGMGLEALKNSDIALLSNITPLNNQLQLATQFLNFQLSSITPKQAEAVLAYIRCDFGDHQQVAKQIGGSRSNASKLLRRSGAILIRDYVLCFEKTLADNIQ